MWYNMRKAAFAHFVRAPLRGYGLFPPGGVNSSLTSFAPLCEGTGCFLLAESTLRSLRSRHSARVRAVSSWRSQLFAHFVRATLRGYGLFPPGGVNSSLTSFAPLFEGTGCFLLAELTLRSLPSPLCEGMGCFLLAESTLRSLPSPLCEGMGCFLLAELTLRSLRSRHSARVRAVSSWRSQLFAHFVRATLRGYGLFPPGGVNSSLTSFAPLCEGTGCFLLAESTLRSLPSPLCEGMGCFLLAELTLRSLRSRHSARVRAVSSWRSQLFAHFVRATLRGYGLFPPGGVNSSLTSFAPLCEGTGCFLLAESTLRSLPSPLCEGTGCFLLAESTLRSLPSPLCEGTGCFLLAESTLRSLPSPLCEGTGCFLLAESTLRSLRSRHSARVRAVSSWRSQLFAHFLRHSARVWAVSS